MPQSQADASSGQHGRLIDGRKIVPAFDAPNDEALPTTGYVVGKRQDDVYNLNDWWLDHSSAVAGF